MLTPCFIDAHRPGHARAVVVVFSHHQGFRYHHRRHHQLHRTALITTTLPTTRCRRPRLGLSTSIALELRTTTIPGARSPRRCLLFILKEVFRQPSHKLDTGSFLIIPVIRTHQWLCMDIGCHPWSLNMHGARVSTINLQVRLICEWSQVTKNLSCPQPVMV